MSERESSFSDRTMILSLFGGAIAGAIVGAAVVLLLAPAARRESAERIRKVTRHLKERASATINTAQQRVSSTVSRGHNFLSEQSAGISSAVEAGVQAGKDAYTRKSA
jgi:gas vesicle protein